ncbi:MAG: ABC transporter permease, partial [Treponema sp.]
SYEDRQKYQIMKKIGMDTSLIKKTTNAQIVWMFFLPLSIAIIHCLFGANLFMLFLHGAGVIYKTEFLSSLGVTVLVVSIIYAFFYLITSKRYNKNI